MSKHVDPGAATDTRRSASVGGYAPPEAAIGRGPSPSADALRRQFTVWG
jgi:hypothetical protein